MNFIIIVLVVCFLAGIIVFNFPVKKQTKNRPEFLEALRKFMEGRLEKIPETEDAYRVIFHFQKRELIYEDIFMPGFKGLVNKAYLKLQANSGFTMTLSEKKERATMRSDIFIASQVSDVEDPVMRNVQIPEALKEFRVHSSDNGKATRIFSDGKMARIIADFKNIDSRGYPICALRIVDGQLILEFHPQARFKPSLVNLYSDVAMIEDYANKLILLADKIERT